MGHSIRILLPADGEVNAYELVFLVKNSLQTSFFSVIRYVCTHTYAHVPQAYVYLFNNIYLKPTPFFLLPSSFRLGESIPLVLVLFYFKQ